MPWKGRHIMRRLPLRGIPALLLLISVGAWLAFPLSSAEAAALAPAIPADASCARLAQADPTATNGPNWGATLLPGHGAPGGWFGVPVCANSVNQVAPGGANLSCDRVPADLARTGCAPGAATSDGYGLTFQCVELVARFAAWAFGVSPAAWRGDAPYLWLSGHHPASFSAFANGGTHAPTPGDVLVWGSLNRQGQPWPAGPAGGHVAVVAAVRGDRITFVEENMLGQHGNIPEETTTLTGRDGHWTIGPTYGTNGGRALYGWLHSSRDSGHFPRSTGSSGSSGSSGASGASPASPAPLPSLTQDTLVTGAGALAQLVWSDTHTQDRPAASAQASATQGTPPHALAESLGAPPGAPLTPSQTPAVVALPAGERYSFALGQNGLLYAAYTTPDAPGALWQALGAPPGITLTSGATALWDGTNVIVGALGSDGALWIRSGPAGMLDSWVSLGRPANTIFQETPALVRAPGSTARSAAGSADSAGNVAWLALAIGRDGALYETDGRADSFAQQTPFQSSSQAAGWSAWEPVTLPDATSLDGGLLVTPETQAASAAQPADLAPTIQTVDALATDTMGRLWLLRRAAMDQPWQARAISLPDASATLLSASLTPGASGSSPALQVYLAGPQANASKAATQPAGQDILTTPLSLNTASAGSAPRWTSLGATPSLAPGSFVALDLGRHLSALAMAQGARIELTGDRAALEVLAPGAGAVSAAPVGEAELVAFGPLAPPQSFSDTFAGNALDPRWIVTGAPSSVAGVTPGALTLPVPSQPGRIAVAQGAPGSAFTVTARVTPDASWRTESMGAERGGAQAGILLTLDDWDTLALSVRSDGTVAFCPVVNGKALPCDTMDAPAPASSSQGLYLRISQSGTDLTGFVSANGVSWLSVGVWSPDWLSNTGASPIGAYAPPAALTDSPDSAVPLAFTSLGLFVETGGAWQAPGPRASASAGTGASVQFHDLTVMAGAQASR